MSNRRKPKKDLRPSFQGSGLLQNVTAPDDEKVLLKQVPAVVPDAHGEKVAIGTCNLYDDGSVDVMIDADAPQWAVDLIKATEMEMGYSIGPFPGTEGLKAAAEIFKENDGSTG